MNMLIRLDTMLDKIKQSSYTPLQFILHGFALANAYKETPQPTDDNVAMVDLFKYLEHVEILQIQDLK